MERVVSSLASCDQFADGEDYKQVLPFHMQCQVLQGFLMLVLDYTAAL